MFGHRVESLWYGSWFHGVGQGCGPCDQFGSFPVIVIFILSTLWWRKIRGSWKLPDGKDWLWGNLGLALMGGAMLSSVAQLCLTLCDSMDYNTPGIPIHHQLPEFTQTHVHWVGDAIQPSHPLLPPSPSALNLSQHQGLFQWVSSSHQVVKVLELQHQSFQWIFRVDFLLDWLVWSPCCPRDSQESSPAPQVSAITTFQVYLAYGC